MGPVLIVSNRLPITISREGGELRVERSSGGLATGLKPLHERGGGRWIGWPGIFGEVSAEEREVLDKTFEGLGVAPVTLSADEVERYYEGYANGVLWPIFHSFTGQLPLEIVGFDTYEAVNRRFADEVVARYRPGDTVWVHDYQLMLVPQMIRERLPDARIGFFLHIPFPPSDIFSTLPNREEILAGLLGADLIGFHTASYMRNFASSVLRILGATSDVDAITWHGRTSAMGAFPMGVDAAAFAALARSEPIQRLAKDVCGASEERLLVGIDRLDSTKGIPRRLLAYERLLEEHPELHGKVRLVQVAVPSRIKVEAYAEFRHQLDALVGRINGRFGTVRWAPVHYVYRNLPPDEVVALYIAADTMLVTPLRDGMNLVAKEFIATRIDGTGALVLSEFTGAASELAEAIHVNPYDVAGMARAIHRALTMSPRERMTRMAGLRQRVTRYNGDWWSRTFMGTLEAVGARAEHQVVGYTSAADITSAVDELRRGERLVLLMDYDGTLVPIAPTPDLAQPDADLRDLLARLTCRPGLELHIVSGRGRDILEEWLGGLPLHLHAEHGAFSRDPSGAWSAIDQLGDEWRRPALEIFEEFAARTPGSLVEQKRSGIAWHYRMADAEFGARQAKELAVHVSAMLSNAPVEVLAGDKVVELRPHGANKGRAAAQILRALPAGAKVAAFGDDRTDEDLFNAVKPIGATFHVGPSMSGATYRLRGVKEVRQFLAALIEGAV
ncbi:MAG: bifunctional alpha,alpha-trehalose-phosphate synthase (UDP-forming)/trehalose-phosphatase [Deltaproteobacteria bacterium]|nr:bifunctional alpha,alpha-trehalose-phosphate synthase (UDP-forming)/trehalose-phosphatase [Deltaproteobacteria bacterium]